jgi:hypothetical protein
MAGCYFEGCVISAPDTDIEGDSKEERRLEEGNLGDMARKWGEAP